MDYKSRSKMQKARRRFEARDLIIALKKSTPCRDCNAGFHPCQIDIVRKDGSKSIQLSKVLHKSKKFIMHELVQCDFVCANCNRMRTWNFQRKNRQEPDDVLDQAEDSVLDT
jgi:hypothetical protein